jgi:hypothetical protein
MDNKQKTAVDFVPYELALELKQLGFDEPCLGHYQDRDETTLHGAVATSKNVYFSIGETNKGFIVRNSPISNCVLAPTYSQAFRWFRDKHQLIHHMYWVYKKMYDGVDWIFHIKGINMINNNVVPHDETRFETYEEAELECLKKLIEIVNDKQ